MNMEIGIFGNVSLQCGILHLHTFTRVLSTCPECLTVYLATLYVTLRSCVFRRSFELISTALGGLYSSRAAVYMFSLFSCAFFCSLIFLIHGGWDLADWLECLAVNVKVATVLGPNPASSDTVESEGRQMKQCWITFKCRKKSTYFSSQKIYLYTELIAMLLKAYKYMN